VTTHDAGRRTVVRATTTAMTVATTAAAGRTHSGATQRAGGAPAGLARACHPAKRVMWKGGGLHVDP